MYAERKAHALVAAICPPELRPVKKNKKTPPPDLPEGHSKQMQDNVAIFLELLGVTPLRSTVNKISSRVANSNMPGECSVPQLLLSGKWMQDAGFKEYGHVRIITIRGMLIIIPGVPPPVQLPGALKKL
jgi:hypothetical protein